MGPLRWDTCRPTRHRGTRTLLRHTLIRAARPACRCRAAPPRNTTGSRRRSCRYRRRTILPSDTSSRPSTGARIGTSHSSTRSRWPWGPCNLPCMRYPHHLVAVGRCRRLAYRFRSGGICPCAGSVQSPSCRCTNHRAGSSPKATKRPGCRYTSDPILARNRPRPRRAGTCRPDTRRSCGNRRRWRRRGCMLPSRSGTVTL